MKASEIKWFNVSRPKIVQRTENTQLRAVAICMEDSDEVFVSLREFSRYKNKEEKAANKHIKECQYRSTSNGVTIKQEALGELIVQLQEIYDDLFERVYHEKAVAKF